MMNLDLARVLVAVSAVAVSLGVEHLAKTQLVSLAVILFYRSLLSLGLIALWLRPTSQDVRVVSSALALIRIVAGGLSFAGWFGAVALLSAPLAVALLQLDLIALSMARRSSAKRAAGVADRCLFLAVLSYVVTHLALAQPGTATLGGFLCAFLGILGRSVSQYVWQLSCEQGEHAFMRMAVPLLGGVAAGVALAGEIPSAPSATAFAIILMTAVFGAIGYGTGDVVIMRQGAFQRRVLEAVAVGGLACAGLMLDEAQRNPLLMSVTVLLTVCACWSVIDGRTQTRRHGASVLAQGRNHMHAVERNFQPPDRMALGAQVDKGGQR